MTGRKGDRHTNSGVFIRMPQELIDQLQTEADARMVSKTWLASRLVIEGLRNLKPVEAPWITEEPKPKPVYRDRPHSRACGIVIHEHGTACSIDCPTCHGKEM